MKIRAFIGILGLILAVSGLVWVHFDAQAKRRLFVFEGDGHFNRLDQRASNVALAADDVVCKVDTDPGNAPKYVSQMVSPYCSMGAVEWAELKPFDSDTSGVFVFDRRCRLKYFGYWKLSGTPVRPEEYCRRAAELDGKHDNVREIVD